MSKRIKREKVKRAGFDPVQKSDGTGGLMVLRVIVIIVIILFICVVATLCYLEFQKDSEELSDIINTNVEVEGFYRQFTAEEAEKLIDYCNNSVSISEYYSVDLSDYNGVQVSSLMKDSLEKMVEAAKKDGIKIDVVQGYMSFDECDTAYKSLKLKFEDEGCSLAEAETEAKKICPPGGNNEYQTGLLIKCSDLDSEDFAKTDTYKWLYKYGIEYGFINRYTEEKSTYTGMNEDLTVFRFVGTDNAQKMRSFGMCLEEYNDYCSYR